MRVARFLAKPSMSNAGETIYAGPEILLSADHVEAFAVEFQKLTGVLLGLRCGAAALESDAAGRGLAITSRQGDELHQVKGDVFIAARSDWESRNFIHG